MGTNVKEQMSGAIQPLSDQLDIVSQLVDSERDFREATNLALEKQILDVRNAVEAEHAARQEDSAGAAQLIQEFHQIMQDGTSPPPEEYHADSLMVCSEATTSTIQQHHKHSRPDSVDSKGVVVTTASTCVGPLES